MKIEIDQSGKIELTSKKTVIAYSNHISLSIEISAREKQKVQKYFKSINKPKLYYYRTFAILIYLLIKSRLRSLNQIIIDTEYPGQSAIIKNVLLGLIRKNTDFDKNKIMFHQIGKKSNAHATANKVFKKGRADIKVTSNDILKYIT